MHKSKLGNYMGFIVALGLLIVIAGGAFVLVQLNSSNQSTDSPGYGDSSDGMIGDSPSSAPGGGPSSQSGLRGNAANNVTGTVTAADATSITINTSGGSRTFAVTDATEVLPGAQQAPQSYDSNDVEIGSTVVIEPDSSDSTKANVIALNYQTRTNQ